MKEDTDDGPHDTPILEGQRVSKGKRRGESHTDDLDTRLVTIIFSALSGAMVGFLLGVMV